MNGVIIEQATFVSSEIRARSPGFTDALVDSAAAMLREFGAFAPGIEVLFVRRLTKWFTVIVQGRDRNARVIAVPNGFYLATPDPFLFSRQFPPEFSASDPLPELMWNELPIPERDIAVIRAILKSDDGPTMLGAAQALVEGGRVAFVRSEPESMLIEQLWRILPDSTRGEISMCSFAAATKNFDVVVTPHVDDPMYLTADKAAEYPEGKYELHLQIAVENDDAETMHRLFARRSGSQAMRLMIRILLLAAIIGITAKLLQP